jgi:hypothetical protein
MYSVDYCVTAWPDPPLFVGPWHSGPCSSPGQFMWDLWCTKWHWDMFALPIPIPPTASHSSSSIIRGWPVSGRRAKWTHFHHTPRTIPLLVVKPLVRKLPRSVRTVCFSPSWWHRRRKGNWYSFQTRRLLTSIQSTGFPCSGHSVDFKRWMNIVACKRSRSDTIYSFGK